MKKVRWSIGLGVLAVATVFLIRSGWKEYSEVNEPAGESESPPPKHVVLIVIDTLRADVVAEVDTPVLDGLAIEGQSPARVWASGTWTAPSIVSLFSGMPVRSHGWDFPFPREMNDRSNSYAPVPEVPLLAEVLAAEGFRTNAFYGNRLLGQNLGYHRGFESFRPSGDRRLPERVTELLSGQDLDERQFLYLHLFGAHQPLRPSLQAASDWSLDRSLIAGRGFALRDAVHGDETDRYQYGLAYRAVVEDIDRRLGVLLEALEPIRDDALLIITSDHGEMLGEQEHFGHFEWLYEPLTWVPFVAVGADELPEYFTLSAVPDLITSTLGVDAEWAVRIDEPGPLVSQREGNLAFSEDGRTKGIWDPVEFEAGFVVFDLLDDPGEERPLDDGSEGVEEARMEWESETPARRLLPVDENMSDEMMDAMEALGYVE